MITLLTVGMRMGIGPFLEPVTQDLNMSRTAFSVIVSVSMIVYGIGMVIGGYLIDRFGTRFTVVLGAVLIHITALFLLKVQDYAGFMLHFGILLSIGLSFTSNVAFTPIISNWFDRLRGRALLFLSTGGMTGIAVITPVETWLIDWIGWRYTILLFSYIFLLLIIPVAVFVLKEHPPAGREGAAAEERIRNRQQADAPGRPQTDAPEMKQIDAPERQQADAPAKKPANAPAASWIRAMGTLPFWQIAFGLFVCGFSMNLLGSHGLPMLTDHGFSREVAAMGIGFIGIVAIFGTIALGTIADRFARNHLIFLIYFVRGIGFLLLVLVSEPWQLFLVAGVAGLVWGGNTALSSALLGDIYGVRLVGILFGWSFFIHQIGAAIGTFLGGWAYETRGTHLISFGAAFLLLIAASLVILKISRKPD